MGEEAGGPTDVIVRDEQERLQFHYAIIEASPCGGPPSFLYLCLVRGSGRVREGGRKGGRGRRGGEKGRQCRSLQDLRHVLMSDWACGWWFNGGGTAMGYVH